VDEKTKRSKLSEKAVRVPSIQLERKAQAIREYLAYLRHRPDLSEYARGVAFVQLLKDLLLDAAPQFLADYLQGMEHSLAGPKTTLYSQGRIDALYGNLVIELKRNLSKSLADAEKQLARYLGILLSNPEDRNRPLIGMEQSEDSSLHGIGRTDHDSKGFFVGQGKSSRILDRHRKLEHKKIAVLQRPPPCAIRLIRVLPSELRLYGHVEALSLPFAKPFGIFRTYSFAILAFVSRWPTCRPRGPVGRLNNGAIASPARSWPQLGPCAQSWGRRLEKVQKRACWKRHRRVQDVLV
jgi:hypothetical protein